MDTNEKIRQIRLLMEKEHIDAVVVPSGDPHKSEYVAEYWQARQWLTGFTGSAGTAVITKTKAVLWTDFRYFIQAGAQIAGTEFELFRQGEPDVPVFEKWLSKILKPGQAVGMDGRLFSCADIKKYKAVLDEKKIILNTNIDVIGHVWKDRPKLPASKAFSFPVTYAGETREDKIKRIREKMESLNTDWCVMTTLDDIAWTLNLRGDDVHCNPVNIAYMLLGKNEALLFMDAGKLDNELVEELKESRITLMDYYEIDSVLSGIKKGQSVLIDPDNTNFHLFQCIQKGCRVIEKPCPAIAFKAVKNEVQIDHMRETAVKDGVAMVNFLYWLETLPKGVKISEVSLAQTLYDFRKQQPLFIDNSFDPIMAYMDHSAMCHYSATPETDAAVGNSGMFLTDSGGNYLTGTTDITRTVCRSDPSEKERKDYTLVLKGHIRVATAVFPKGTKGFQIDALARQFLWQNGMDFGHGTGHGVGFFLSVHEGPARISPVNSETELEKGMLLTNEPGVYKEGRYGIRLENMILVQEAFENEFGRFLEFEQMTFCHFERDLIQIKILTKEEKKWVDEYHKTVYDTLSDRLDKQTAKWLKEKTRPL